MSNSGRRCGESVAIVGAPTVSVAMGLVVACSLHYLTLSLPLCFACCGEHLTVFNGNYVRCCKFRCPFDDSVSITNSASQGSPASGAVVIFNSTFDLFQFIKAPVVNSEGEAVTMGRRRFHVHCVTV